MRHRVRISPGLALGVATLVVFACREATGPSSNLAGSPGVTIIAGGQQSDTANAQLTQALVLRITDSAGVPAGREVVRFLSVPADSQTGTPSALVSALTSLYYSTFAAESTDDSGEVAILIQLGRVAGHGRVAVTVPRFGYADTVSFTILPGAAVRLGGLRDTAMYAGRSGPLHAFVADQNGNRRPDAVTFQSLNASVASVTSAGIVTAVSLGRAKILVQGPTPNLKDSTYVSVVPVGTIAAVVGAFRNFSPGTVVTMNLDGSGVTPVPQSAADNQYLSWTPDGTTLLGHRGYHVFAMDLTGAARLVVPAAAAFSEDVWPRYTATGGGWVYFAGVQGSVALYRIRLDGTGLDSLPVGFGTQPCPSPDGTRVAWTDAVSLHVYSYATGADTTLNLFGYAPHWSPDGTLIAFATGDPGTISVMKPDGSARRVLGGGASFGWAFDWSPDGQWLVVYDYNLGSLALLQVQTGLVLPLGYTTGLGQPAWKP